MQTAVERWKEVLQARAAQMDAAYARLGRTSADFWDRRARGFHRSTRESASSDPFYTRVRERVNASESILDVGAGTGRFSLALAPYARQVIALEPNAAMLSYLRAEIEASGANNITTVQSRWEDTPADLRAEIVICCHVLYPILDIVPFLRKLHSASQQACYLYLRATHIDALTAPLWRHFHGDERQLPPGYIHALDILYELGIYAQVEVVKAPYTLNYPTVQDAEDELIEQLILEDTPHTREKLRALLENWLSEQADHTWSSPQQEIVSAILWWTRDH
ncbi:MAG TPA: class I SAM-dependent methyltransferase [Ktedonobacteraceae bacterium]|nr:class I SAM-dependent methyltransferase [Ktedonobacteraceae bacterium]